ncbi:MAG: C10 family peptidase [Alistipes sp.]|nr:C10 family peptidase [Alistipes sp.]
MRRIFILFALLIVAFELRAEQVTSERATEVAREVLGGVTRSQDMLVVWDSSLFAQTRVERVEPTFYVVTPSSGAGFVVVAGDDVVAPVLAYSETSFAPLSDNLPKNFEAWLRYVDRVVREARTSGVKPCNAVAQLWSEGYQPVEALMLNTARWSQMAPYNDQCPLDDGARSLTGCTQTAMAIIMKHHRWPQSGKGSTIEYTTQTKGIYVPSRDLNHSYDWDNMLETYVEGEYDDAEAYAVATIMADLGYAFKAEYTANDTAAMPDMNVLYKNFGYSPASRIVSPTFNISYDYWVELLRRELEANRPIFYVGYTSDMAGHAFVLDGVDANDYFHTNWGWNGLYDGFFMLDNLTLDQYHFSDTHWAVLGMHPMRDGEIDNGLSLASSGLSISETQFERGKEFRVESLSVVNNTLLLLSGELRVGVCDAQGEWKSWATDAVKFLLLSGHQTSEQNLRAVVEQDIELGDRLCAFYRIDGSEKWFRMYSSSEGATDEVVMKYAPIGDTTSMSYDKSTGLVILEYDEDVKSALYSFSNDYVESGVTITRGRMVIDTQYLASESEYTILLRREGVEDKYIRFKINKAQ